jgi:adenylosuccinate synthase
VAYNLDGERIDYLPADLRALARCQPVYQVLPGWDSDITGVRAMTELPLSAQDYIARIEELTGIPATYISVGPGREQTICP